MSHRVSKPVKGTWKQLPISTNIMVSPTGEIRNIARGGRAPVGREVNNTTIYNFGGSAYSIEELVYLTYISDTLAAKDTVRLVDPNLGVSPDNLERVEWRKHRRGVLARRRDKVRVTPVTWIDNQWVQSDAAFEDEVKDAATLIGVTSGQIWYRCKRKDGTLVDYVFSNPETPFDGFKCSLVSGDDE